MADEARLVVDCVDAYRGSGAAPFDELAALLGSPRRRGNVRRALRRLTHFEATCPETGLPNAYRVTANPTRAAEGRDEVDVTMANGEVRRRWTNPERFRRVELLCRLGLVSPTLERRDVETLCPLPGDLRVVLPHDLEVELPRGVNAVAAATLATREPASAPDAYAAWFATPPGAPPQSSQERAFGVEATVRTSTWRPALRCDDTWRVRGGRRGEERMDCSTTIAHMYTHRSGARRAALHLTRFLISALCGVVPAHAHVPDSACHRRRGAARGTVACCARAGGSTRGA